MIGLFTEGNEGKEGRRIGSTLALERLKGVIARGWSGFGVGVVAGRREVCGTRADCAQRVGLFTE